MALSKSTLEQLLRESFPDAILVITDLAGDNDHWKVEITSKSFFGLSKVQQHQKVYGALNGLVGSTLHALSLTTHCP